MLIERGSIEARVKDSMRILRLRGFYNRETDKYFINFNFLTKEVINAIMIQMKDGAILGLNDEGNAQYEYVLSREDANRLQAINVTKGKLNNSLSEARCDYFESIKVEEYPDYADVIDSVLHSCNKDNYVDGWAIVLTLERGKFVFKECFGYSYSK